MSDLQQLLKDLSIGQRAFGRGVGLSKSAANRLVAQGHWPTRCSPDLAGRIATFLANKGATPKQLAFLESKKAPASSQLTGAPEASSQLATPSHHTAEREDEMLLEFENLTDHAKTTWGLRRSPFVDDIESRDDVFNSQDIRRVRAALMDAATQHGFVAIIGESGAGKSTMREEFEQRILDEGKSIIVMKPYTLGMEETKTKGKPMLSGQIAVSIARALAPTRLCRRRSRRRLRPDRGHGLALLKGPQ